MTFGTVYHSHRRWLHVAAVILLLSTMAGDPARGQGEEKRRVTLAITTDGGDVGRDLNNYACIPGWKSVSPTGEISLWLTEDGALDGKCQDDRDY